LKFTRCWTRSLFAFRWAAGDATFADICKVVTSEQAALWIDQDLQNPTKQLAHSEYFREYLPQVNDFLFAEMGESGCRYFQIATASVPQPLRDGCAVWSKRLDLEESVFNNLRQLGRPTPRGVQLLGAKAQGAVWKNKPPKTEGPPSDGTVLLPFRVRVEPKTRVEMWLGRSGAGVLSLSLVCQPDEGQSGKFIDGLIELCHSLATVQRTAWFQRSDEDNQWQHIHQWLRELLHPLNANASVEYDLRGVVCTAVEVAEPEAMDASFDRVLEKQLSHLAQVHPVSHPGEEAEGHARLMTINHRHRCALSLGGAAHAVIVPAASGAQYDENRLRRIQMEYFPGYLLAHIQRLCLQQFIHESASTSREPDPVVQRAGFERLLSKVMRFGLEGEFVQACWRGKLQQHHESAQQVCLIHEGMQTVRSAMSDFAAVTNQQFEREQHAAAERAEAKHREEAQQSERTMQVLEVFIVTFYSVELAHILSEAFDFGHTPFVGWSLIAVALSSFAMASILVSWRRLSRKGTKATIISLFLMASLIHAGFLGVNRWWQVSSSHEPPSRIEAPAREHDSLDERHP
jgi:hypothetical protein